MNYCVNGRVYYSVNGKCLLQRFPMLFGKLMLIWINSLKRMIYPVLAGHGLSFLFQSREHFLMMAIICIYVMLHVYYI